VPKAKAAAKVCEARVVRKLKNLFSLFLCGVANGLQGNQPLVLTIDCKMNCVQRGPFFLKNKHLIL
jgi:hypothetical protein